ncbi:MAG TPA: universal stress protein [Myxococcota bacterium]|nr:universal stress protein [Myxococcota bacterium]
MSFSPRHILVPVAIDTEDDLHLAEQALFVACDMAEKFASKITLLHLAPVITPGVSASVDMSGRMYHSFIKVLETRLAHGRRKLGELRDLAEKRGLNIRGQVIESLERTGGVIVDVAKEQDIDLIVLGSHGRSGLSKMLFGSVAAYVVQHATMPVLVLHPMKGT